MAVVTLADSAICHANEVRARGLHVAFDNTWFPLVAVGIEDTHRMSRVYPRERFGCFVALQLLLFQPCLEFGVGIAIC